MNEKIKNKRKFQIIGNLKRVPEEYEEYGEMPDWLWDEIKNTEPVKNILRMEEELERLWQKKKK